MIKYLKKTIFFLTIIYTFSCQTESPVPTYLYVKPFKFNGKDSVSNKISAVWLYVNNEFLGTYSLPAHIPIIAENKADYVLFPGILDNGIATTPNLYNFYTKYELLNRTITLSKTDTISPKTQYAEDAFFDLNATFEGDNLLNYDADANPNSTVQLQKNAWNNTQSAYIALDKSNPSITFASSPTFQKIPKNLNDVVYLELDYKSDVAIKFGVSTPNALIKNYILGLNPKKEWTKIYINLTQNLIDLRLTDYRLFFEATLPSSSEKAAILFDNIKLVRIKS